MEQLVILSQREQEYLLRIIEAAVRVRDQHQFYLLTQGQLQALLPHRLMLCMQFDGADALVRLECLHGSVVGELVMQQLCDPFTGLGVRLARQCKSGTGELAGFEAELERLGLDNVVAHGSGALAGGATLFALCGFPLRPSARQAYFLELLLPHLHMALLRLSPVSAGEVAMKAQASMSRPLSAREAEILAWVSEGKSNYEVGRILGISALTVKNHLQRVYRLLGVSNRAHALSRCLSLRLLDPKPPGPAPAAPARAQLEAA
ncbi:MAG: LuxR C-terminal-related transcriptional regulator [Massilia sp.]